MWTAAELHRRCAPRIHRHLRALLGPDHEHEDLVHDILIVVLTRIGTLRDPARIDGWVAQITLNVLRQRLHHRRLRRHASWEALPEEKSPPFSVDVEGHQLAARAIRVMERLPERDRSLLVAHWLSPSTLRQIAAETGCSIVTVRRRLSRAQSRFERLALGDPELAARMEAGPRHA